MTIFDYARPSTGEKSTVLLRRQPRGFQHAINRGNPNSKLILRDPFAGKPLPVKFKNLVALSPSLGDALAFSHFAFASFFGLGCGGS